MSGLPRNGNRSENSSLDEIPGDGLRKPGKPLAMEIGGDVRSLPNFETIVRGEAAREPPGEKLSCKIGRAGPAG